MSRKDKEQRRPWYADGRLWVVFLVGLCVGLAPFFAGTLRAKTMTKGLRESDIPSSSGYIYTDPLLGISNSQSDSPEFTGLKNQLQSYIKGASGLTDASVYFRDLREGQGFTINPGDKYNPASLQKVPLMMAYYALAEKDPSVLNQPIYYAGGQDSDSQEDIESPIQLTPGTTYTVDQLIDHMIKNSDNNALGLLLQHLSDIGQMQVLNDIFNDLGIDPGSLTVPSDFLTVQSYSLFLRVLYNATYLDRIDSEKALKLMSESDFTAGISSGVPNAVQVAQKFGESRIADQSGAIIGGELHNCGIVYYPNHPYLLCIMTKGDTKPDLEKAIAGISSITYKSVVAKYH